MKPIKMVSEIDQGLHAPTKIPKDIKMLKEDAAPPTMAGVAGMSGMGSGSGVPGGVMGGIGNAPAPVVKVAPPKGPQRVSSGVMPVSKISRRARRSIRRLRRRRTFGCGGAARHHLEAGHDQESDSDQRAGDAADSGHGSGTELAVQAISVERRAHRGGNARLPSTSTLAAAKTRASAAAQSFLAGLPRVSNFWGIPR